MAKSFSWLYKVSVMGIIKKIPVMLAVGVMVTCIAILFQTAFAVTLEAWQTEEYSHGYLVPLIGLMLLLYKAQDVTVPHRNSWLGLVGIIFCILCLFLFEIAGIRGIQPLLLVAFLYSMFITFYGVRFTLAMIAPLGFFMFLVPLPKFLYYQLSFGMQMISTDFSVWMLQASDISVFQEGNIIDLGIMKMEVAEACNGLRYLFPLMALGYLMAFMYKAPMWKRSFLFVSTVPITILLNSVRIFLIGVSANVWSPEVASGIVHDVEGWVIFLACFLVLVLEIVILQKIGAKGEIDFDCLMLPSKDSLKLFSAIQWRLPAQIMIGVLVIAIVSFAYMSSKGWGDIKPVSLEKPFAEFPMQIGTWVGRPDVMDRQSLAVLGTEDYLLADYRTLQGDLVNLYILYYPKQDSTSNQAVHSPEVCIPGGGWVITSHTTDNLIVRDGQVQTINRLIIEKGRQRQLVYYWFYQGENISANAFATRLSIMNRAIMEGKANGGMIRLVTPIGLLESEEDADERLRSFYNSGSDIIQEWTN